MTNQRTIQARRLQPFISQTGQDAATVVTSTTFASGIIFFHVDGSLMTVYPGSDAGLTEAIAAVISGDLILMPNMAFTVDVTIPAGVKMTSFGNTSLSGTVTLGGNNTVIERLHLGKSASSNDNLNRVVGPASGTATIKNCFVDDTNTGAGGAYAVVIGEGNVNIWDSSIQATAASGLGIGICKTGSAGEVTQYGGLVSGSDYNVAKITPGGAVKGEVLGTGSLDGGPGGATGTHVTGLTVGNWYCVETSGGPWYMGSATPDYKSYTMAASETSTYDPDTKMGYSFYLSHGFWDEVPAWADSGARVGSYYYRFFFQAGGTSIYLWTADGYWDDNAPGYSLTYTLYAALAAIDTDVDGWYHASAVAGGENGEPLAGDRSAFDAVNYASRHANDTDVSGTALHHTLGTAANQAAAGDHTHAAGSGDVIQDGSITAGNLAVWSADHHIEDGGPISGIIIPGVMAGLTPPVLTGFTEIAPATGSTATQDGDTIIAKTTTGSQNRPWVKSAPTAPYTITVGFQYFGLSGDKGAELYWRDSGSGKLISVDFIPYTSGMQWLEWDSASSWHATVWTSDYLYPLTTPIVWARISDDASRLRLAISVDGKEFVEIYSAVRNSFLDTPDQVGFGVRENTGSPWMTMRLYSWLEA